MTNAETGVTVIEQSPDAIVEWNLDNWPTDQFNRLVPTQTLGLATEFIRPVIATVQLDIETDTYESNDLKAGHRAPNAKGLSKLADAAGVNFTDEIRLDDGSNPARAYVRVTASIVDATGTLRRTQGSRDYVLESQPMTDAQRTRAKGYVHEHAATRARHRAMRGLLSLPQSYPVAELRKPFAVARFVPNMQHPEIRAAYKAAMVGAITALYGPEPARQLGSGDVVEVPEAPEDDEPVPAQRALTPGRAPAVAPDSAPAASAAPGAPEEPDWMRGTDVTPAVAAAPAELGLREIIAARLRDEGQPKGPMIARQQEMLKGVFAPFGEERGAALVAGVEVLFGGSWKDLTCAQARAIGMAHDELGSAAFVAAWRELVA